MIVTIDGPAGAGKSTVARALAKRLGFRFLDTGAMYRAVALAAVRRNVPWEDADALAELARQLDIRFDGDRVLLNGQDISPAIRTSEITACIRHVADNQQVRQRLVELQRQIADGVDIVTEGRDQGTVAFPNAQCKIFLTATPQERARRRVQDLQEQGETVTVQEVLEQQNARDLQDRQRAVGALVAADDAVEFLTDGLSQEQVVDRLAEMVTQRKPA